MHPVYWPRAAHPLLRILFSGSLLLFVWQITQRSAAAETIFLRDGRTIQADKVEIIGDRIRIEKPTEIIDLPRSQIRAIHPTKPPSGTPAPTPPADVYRNLGQEMNDRVRREIESRPGVPGGR
jgi:hypothetical protein